MPKRTDIKSILLIGSGPIVIGQACEFDYSGTQALKALKEEGYRMILVNSNPATIMTDPDFADRTYIEPITVDMVEKIIAQERPDAFLPTLGGQTALNVAIDLAEQGILQQYGVEMIGAKLDAIKKAEDRDLFKLAMNKLELDLPRSGYAHSLEEAFEIQRELQFPLVIRPLRTLGGSGAGIAYGQEEFTEAVTWGLKLSPVHEVLVEESVLGWKEFELEVMRDHKDNVVIVCSIENFDPMGVHTGDSITVAPSQTLTDKEYQIMRDAALKIIREIGVDTGGSNIQFAVNPKDGRLVVIEMNPRVSRSSALASKATGFPIAKIAAKLAVGYTLDEIPNDITRETQACFEPTIDYVVVKIPRFTFEKFPQATDCLTTQMKSVGEAMAIGRTFKEALQKAMRSLEVGSFGFDERLMPEGDLEKVEGFIKKKLEIPNAQRLWYLAEAFRRGYSVSDVCQLTQIDPWFLQHLREIVETESKIQQWNKTTPPTGELLYTVKQMGFSDRRLAHLMGRKEEEIRSLRLQHGIRAVYRTVDTCAAEFAAYTPYLYSTYEGEDESNPSGRKKIMILGGGPNRIGQGIEFDYCCVHAAFALKEDGYETIMVNCNPEMVSTDYDTSDKLYFEPLTLEDVLSIVDVEKPDGVIVQFGGQTPLRLALSLEKAGVKLIGTSPDNIDLAEDRDRFRELLQKLGLKQPVSGSARTYEEGKGIASRIGYPVLVRPSYVLGGRAMDIVYDENDLKLYMTNAVAASPEHPVLIDKFLDDAIEVDVDALADGEDVVIGGIMEHIERAGVHSGDSACSLPPKSIGASVQDEIRRQTVSLARALCVRGLMNVQFAVKGTEVFVLEVNPRASRTVPFVSKAIGIPLAKIAARVMVGQKLRDLGMSHEIIPTHISVKESVFPFSKFPGVDTLLGPEMKSTGEVMGIDHSFGQAFAKAQLGGGMRLPQTGKVFISIRDEHKEKAGVIAHRLHKIGFRILATKGTAEFFKKMNIPTEVINKVQEGSPHVADAIQSGEVAMVINTPTDAHSQADSYYIRRNALDFQVPYFTTIAGADAAVEGIELLKDGELVVRALQEYRATTRGVTQPSTE